MPLKGKSKTRLIPRFGEDGAFRVARALLCDTLYRFGFAPEFDGARRVACFAPAEAACVLQELVEDAGVDHDFWERSAMAPHELTGSDLGGFLRTEYERVRRESTGAVVIVGMDSPDLPVDFVLDAAGAARAGAAVVHDSTDGGYVLVALPPDAPGAVFDDVEWSTTRTAASQRARLEACGVRVEAQRGEAWGDVDEAEDLLALLDRLAKKEAGECPSLDAVAWTLATSGEASVW